MHVCSHPPSQSPPAPPGAPHSEPAAPPPDRALESRRVLLADDDPVQTLLLQKWLKRWGYEVEIYADGLSAWEALEADNAPPLVILDWMMPGLDGLEVCRRLRARPSHRPVYIIILTGHGDREDLVQGLNAGADDYLQKPAHKEELAARIRNAARVVELQLSLRGRIAELEDALAKVKQLQGLLPICAYCKKIRNDHNYWEQVEAYLQTYADVRFSHGICPDCYTTIIEPQLRAIEE